MQASEEEIFVKVNNASYYLTYQMQDDSLKINSDFITGLYYYDGFFMITFFSPVTIDKIVEQYAHLVHNCKYNCAAAINNVITLDVARYSFKKLLPMF